VISAVYAERFAASGADVMMHGFWSAGDYVGIQRSFVYPDEALSVDRYVIVEPGNTWQVFNWFQHFTPARLQKELDSAGFDHCQMFGGLTGEPLQTDGELIAVIANTV